MDIMLCLQWLLMKLSAKLQDACLVGLGKSSARAIQIDPKSSD